MPTPEQQERLRAMSSAAQSGEGIAETITPAPGSRPREEFPTEQLTPFAPGEGNYPGVPIFSSGDASDAYANQKQLYLGFFHLASGREVRFKGFITNFNQNFSSEYVPEQVFGRNDPIMTFKSTTRKMNVSFQVVAASMTEAKENLLRCNRLTQFMYPAYEKGNRADTIAKPPLMRIAFANIIQDPGRGSSPAASESGVLCAVATLNMTPSFGDEGFFDPGVAQLYPKLITIDVDMTVLHERDLGWDASVTQGRSADGAFGFSGTGVEAYPFGLEGFVPQSGQSDTAPNLEDEETDADRAEAAADQAGNLSAVTGGSASTGGDGSLDALIEQSRNTYGGGSNGGAGGSNGGGGY
jgi:hypothetical protein